MALETGTYISDLVATNPPGTDDRSTADDHLRLIKSTIKNSFPNITGAMTASHTELNLVDGFTGTTADFNILAGAAAAGLTNTEIEYVKDVTSLIQAQFNEITGANSNITSLTGLTTDLAIIHGGTGSSTQSGARSNLGLGGLAILSSVGQSTIDGDSVGQSELKTATQETSAGHGAGQSFLSVQISSDYTLGAAVKVGGTSGNSLSYFIDTIKTATLGSKSTTYVSGYKYQAEFNQTNNITNYLRVRYVTASPPYVGENGLMHLFVYLVLDDNGDILRVNVCDDPPWPQQSYKKENGKKIISSLNTTKVKPFIEKRELIMADKFTKMNEKPHPFEESGNIVMIDPTTDFMAELLEIHEAGESVCELFHGGLIVLGGASATYAPTGIKVISAAWA